MGPADWTFPEKLTTCDVSATIGRNKIESFGKVMMSMNVVQTTALFGHYIRFELSDENDVRTEKRHNIGDKEDHVDSQRPTMGKRNAFQILLDGARKSTLPKPFDLNKKVVNNKIVLYISIFFNNKKTKKTKKNKKQKTKKTNKKKWLPHHFLQQ